MKNTTENKGLLIENEILENANLGDNVRLLATENIVTLTKGKMTAIDVIKDIDSLTGILQSYVEELAECCGDCDDCGHCENMDFEGIHLPEDLLKTAGIPEGSKLNAFVEEGCEVIHIEPAQYDYDISDVPPHLLRLFSSYGICLGELDALLVRGDVLNG